MIPCTGCGNPNPYKTVSGNGWEYCDRCGDMPSVGVADVYWDGSPEHGLADDPKTGQPMVFSSRGEKARYLRDNNLIEAGDKVRGAPPSILNQPQRHEDSRVMAEQALAHVRQMGSDYRRQEYLRIKKQSGRI